MRLRRLESPFQVLEKVYGRTDNAAVHVLFAKLSSGLKALGISPLLPGKLMVGLKNN